MELEKEERDPYVVTIHMETLPEERDEIVEDENENVPEDPVFTQEQMSYQNDEGEFLHVPFLFPTDVIEISSYFHRANVVDNDGPIVLMRFNRDEPDGTNPPGTIVKVSGHKKRCRKISILDRKRVPLIRSKKTRIEMKAVVYGKYDVFILLRALYRTEGTNVRSLSIASKRMFVV